MTLSLIAFAALVSLARGASYKPPSGSYQPPSSGSYQFPSFGGDYSGYQPSTPSSDVLDEGDKLNARLASLSARLNFQQERFASLNQRLSLQRNTLDTLTKVYLAEIKNNDEVQDSSISIIWQKADATGYALVDLKAVLDELVAANAEGADAQVEVSDAITRAVKVNVRQNAQITELHTKISDLKKKLLQLLSNLLQVFKNKVGATETVLDGAVATEKRRRCETGRVLFLQPGKREYSFQTPFDGVPSVTVGLCDIRYNLNVRPPVSQGYSYGPEIPEPNAVGANVIYYATENSVIINGLDEAFGDTQATAAEVCFTACSITPNIFYPLPSDH